MASNLKTTELDFDDIKRNLKNFLKRQTVFNDYDFDGAGLNVLLDVLAYNTHYNAMAGHLALNEAFLDSAQIRGNAVSRARMLGYVPASRLSPRAEINLVVDVSSVAGTKPTNLSLPRGTKLSTSVDGETYQFVTLNTQSATIVGNTYTYNNVIIAEGNYNSIKYRVDNDIENQKHQIPHKNVDTSTLRTRVQANEESTSFDIFTLFATLLNVDASSKIYHLQENTSGFYEVYFGDGVTGSKPLNNNIVTLDYVYSNGTEANGANVFQMVDNIGGFSNITVTTVKTAAGGADGETLESIRYNAPLTYTSQNRAVTADDYRAIIQREFSNIDAISTWGGEDEAVPDYGKIFIAIKPKTADKLTDDEKATVTGTVLQGKNVVSITPTVVDPNYSFIELDVSFKYNPNLTDRSSVELQSVVRDTISDYNFNNLNKFDGVFRHSQLTRAIDNSDPSILNTIVRPRMFQNITPVNNADNNFNLSFVAPFYQSGNSTAFILTSSAFKINNVDHFFGDEPITGSTKRNVIVYKVVNNINVIVTPNAGEIDVTKGTMILNNFRPDTTADIKITVLPNSLDLAPKRDQLISINNNSVVITPEVDTIAVAGSAGSITYNTTSRFK